MLQIAARQKSRVRGRVFTVHIDTQTGRVVRSANHNIITRAGLATWVQHLISAQSYLATCKVGTGLTVPADTDTALTTLLTSKSIGTWDVTNATGANPYIVARTQFDEAEAVGSITETGLFFADASMFNHALFGSGVITGATQANPCVITDVAHGLVDSQRIIIEAVGGMTQLNGNTYYVNVLTADTFSLHSDAALAVNINSTGFGAYTSGGTWKISINKTSSTILVVRIEIEIANA